MDGGRRRLSPSGGIERYLAHGERVVLVLRRHSVVLGWAVGLWLGAIAAGLGLGLLSGTLKGWHLGTIGGWLVLAGAAVLAFKAWGWWVARYVITDQRVLLVDGVVGRRVRAVPLSKVTHTDFRKSFLGRLMGYGDLALDSPGSQMGLRELTSIPKPDEIYRLVVSLVAGGSGAGGVRRGITPNPGLDVRPVVNNSPSDPSTEDTGPLPRLIF